MARRIPTWAADQERDGRKKHREYDAEVWLNLEKKELRAVMLETQVGRSGCTAVACTVHSLCIIHCVFIFC